ADHGKQLALVDVEIHPVDRVNDAVLGVEDGLQVADCQYLAYRPTPNASPGVRHRVMCSPLRGSCLRSVAREAFGFQHFKPDRTDLIGAGRRLRKRITE